MTILEEKFTALATDNAPGQAHRQNPGDIGAMVRGEKLEGTPIDFSHGDIDAFPPPPGAFEAWKSGYDAGGQQAYTEYRGAASIRESLAVRLGALTGREISPDRELIITPGTQGALFLALGATVASGTKVAIIEPDYFANRKLVKFFGGHIIPIPLCYQSTDTNNGPDLDRLEAAFKYQTKVLVFSTPNNPTGLVYSKQTIKAISALAAAYGVTVIVDQLYSRLLYSGEVYTHLRACTARPDKLITIMGPSKTESLSGFRLGTAFGSPELIDRMEQLQAIVSLRAAGYNQAVLETWLGEPSGWLDERIGYHQVIRDDLLEIFRAANFQTTAPQAGSYLFPQLPPLKGDIDTFIRLLRYQANVTVTPGLEFGPTSENSIRLNFSQNRELAIDAAKRIVTMVDRYRV